MAVFERIFNIASVEDREVAQNFSNLVCAPLVMGQCRFSHHKQWGLFLHPFKLG